MTALLEVKRGEGGRSDSLTEGNVLNVESTGDRWFVSALGFDVSPTSVDLDLRSDLREDLLDFLASSGEHSTVFGEILAASAGSRCGSASAFSTNFSDFWSASDASVDEMSQLGDGSSASWDWSD